MKITQLVVFRLREEEYAMPIEQVREIINSIPVTKLPDTPSYVVGVINVRGKIISVVDFAAKLGLVENQVSKQIVIVEVLGKEVGLTVDEVTEVIQTVQENFAVVDSLVGGGRGVNNVYKLEQRIIVLLDLEHILLDKETILSPELVKCAS